MKGSPLVTVQDLASRLADPGWVVFDCRFDLTDPAAGERAYHGAHIPGARYAHLDRDLSSPVTAVSGRHPLPPPAALAAKLAAWGLGAGCRAVVYDEVSGPFAARLWWLLRWLGHGEAAVLDGGWRAWRAAGLPVTPAAVTPAPAVFMPRPADDRWVGAGFVERVLRRGGWVLVDARAAERFAGAVEPLDPVAGHIPGARNRPFAANLDGAGRLRPAAELRRDFTGLLGAVPPARVIHMCGSGVTACHNILAMEAAGLGGARLYAGSWSEWIRDPRRPVATGPL